MHKPSSATLASRTGAIAVAVALAGALVTSASAQIAFQDVSIAAGFANSNTESWGASWGDYDGDHYPDLFSSNHRMRATLYHNNRDGTFTDTSWQVDASHTPGWTGGRSDVDTHGATWVDIDNDGDEDLMEGVSSSANVLHINDGGVLTDQSIAHGIDKIWSSGTRQIVFYDYNNDGLLDLASMSLYSPALYQQKPDGTFGSPQTMACAGDGEWGHLADINSSPGFELVCSQRKGTYPKVNAFQNGVMSDVTAQYPASSPVNDAVELDYNGDLRPDLFLVRSSEKPSDAYQYDATHFETQLITAANKSKYVKFKTTGLITLTVSTRGGDTSSDGDPIDIVIGSSPSSSHGHSVTYGYSPTSLQFTLDSSDPRNSGILTGSVGINVGYLPATGEWEILSGYSKYNYSYVQVSSSAEITGLTFYGASGSDLGYRPYLMNNTVSGLVRDTKAGFSTNVRCSSAVTGDFDNDMHEDIYLTCTGGSHNTPNRLFWNNGQWNSFTQNGVSKGKFIEVANAGGAAGIQGAAVGEHAGTADVVVSADYDLDGFLDLLVMNGSNMRPVYMGGPKQLFHNLGNGNHWMEFDLVGTTSNRDGVGSKVYVTSGGITQYREQNGGYHRWSQNFSRVHVGLAANTLADVSVVWPDGSSTTYRGLDANHIYQLKQDGTNVQIH